jgi:carbon-monoxide dehydrogenase medium subunit
MIPASFAYQAAGSVEEAVSLLAEHGDSAKLLAGGQSLLPLLKLRFVSPGVLIDLGRLEELRRVDVNGVLRVGALVTHDQLGRHAGLAEAYPVIADAAADVADPLVRNRGTFGGSLAHADPAGDWPAVALALGATLRVSGVDEDRTIGVDDFFTDVYATALGETEVLTAVDIVPPTAGTRSAYVKVAHPASGYALAAAAVVLRLDAAGAVAIARVALTGVASVPFRALGTEAALVGQVPSAEVARAAAALAVEGVDVLGDEFTSTAYRRHLASVVTARAIRRAVER